MNLPLLRRPLERGRRRGVALKTGGVEPDVEGTGYLGTARVVETDYYRQRYRCFAEHVHLNKPLPADKKLVEAPRSPLASPQSKARSVPMNIGYHKALTFFFGAALARRTTEALLDCVTALAEKKNPRHNERGFANAKLTKRIRPPVGD